MTTKAYNAEEAIATRVRKTTQDLMPLKLAGRLTANDEYNVYPVSSLGANKINSGYSSLAHWIMDQKTVVIDGYAGVFWERVQSELHRIFREAGLTVQWITTNDYWKASSVVDDLVQPYLGADDSVWGTKCLLSLEDLFQIEGLQSQRVNAACDISIIIGPGASLSNWDVPLIYVDLPKNELQFRMRAGSITNLGSTEAQDPFSMYKRFYFVDWVLLNAHKKAILNKISVVADSQWEDEINWMFAADFKQALDGLSRSVFRVRPWFEPGAWGGDWIKNNIRNINKDVVNYAWSFELIVPENGLVFESNGFLLEVSFDFLMFHNREKVLGKHAQKFGDEFPIRFDFLDTYNGGNLSIQCHPTVPYIQTVFGEIITQDETYYILDCEENAKVYLGFQESVDPAEFQEELEASQEDGHEVNVEKYVQAHPAHKHDLFLIPNGTIHSAGAGNLVLEISATPYIFTFKMYDWLRLDLDGKPRPINIEHAFNNLDFSRKGSSVQQELISKPIILEAKPGYELIHLPTHREHFYDIHRIEFDEQFAVETDDNCHVLMLVEGQSIAIETHNGTKQEFAYAETFVVPAAARSYKLYNKGSERAKVIKAFLKHV